MTKHTLVSWFAGLCALFGLLSVSTTASAQQILELRPNLEALPALDIAVEPDLLGGSRLVFSTVTWNNGSGPLELIAGETGSGRQNVYQRVYLDNGTFYDRLAGTFEWHPAHNHFHLEDYAVYALQSANAPGGSKRTSSKTTFCVMDTDKFDGHLPGAPKKAVYTTCRADFQGMSVGWGDEYGSFLPGQEIDLTGLPDGDYRLTIEADPKNRLVEADEGDNTSCVLLRIGVTAGSVVVLNDSGCGAPGGGEVSVVAIDPNIVTRGSVNPAIIIGSGFAAGMGVTFEGGSGPQPKASDVVVVDGGTITANVTAKAGGPARTQTWDVRVGPGILLGGLTVQP